MDDVIKQVTCKYCGVVKDALILPPLVLCHGCDAQVIKQATVSVTGPVYRDHICSGCVQPKPLPEPLPEPDPEG